jgi:hypothetical protein
VSDLVTETAYAIYQTWSRERDPQRARQRFERLPDVTREQFQAEAKSAIRVVEAFHRAEAA